MNIEFNSQYIQSILDDGIMESDILELKKYIFSNGKFNSLDQKEINTLMKEICSFANQNGGVVIIGLSEDDKHNPSEIVDCNVKKEDFETWEQSFRNKIATTTIPALYGVSVFHLNLEDKNCIVIDIPRSILKPHAFNTGSKDEFYIRNGNESRPMRYNDLKYGFNALEYTQNRISQFRDNRISFILDGELDDSLSTDTALIIHIIPEWSLDNSNFLDLRSLLYKDKFKNISPGRKGSQYFNADGFIDVYGSSEREYMAYVQLFTNGVVESAEIRLLNDYKENIIYKWFELEQLISKRIFEYCNELDSMGVKSDYHISVSLLNAKGKFAEYNSWGDKSPIIKCSIIKTPIVKWSMSDSFENTLYPILTSLAHSFGLEMSGMYDENLVPIKKKFDFLYADIKELPR